MDKQSLEKYWRQNIKYVLSLLGVWFLVSYVLGILVDWSGRFWMAQQGSMYVFVILIFIYVYLMNKLDEKHDVQEK